MGWIGPGAIHTLGLFRVQPVPFCLPAESRCSQKPHEDLGTTLLGASNNQIPEPSRTPYIMHSLAWSIVLEQCKMSVSHGVVMSLPGIHFKSSKEWSLRRLQISPMSRMKKS